MTKWIGLLFFVISTTEWRTFYGKMPRALVFLLVFLGIGVGIDLANCESFDLSEINELSRPLLMWILMLASYNLAINNRFDRRGNHLRVVYSARVLPMHESGRIGCEH